MPLTTEQLEQFTEERSEEQLKNLLVKITNFPQEMAYRYGLTMWDVFALHKYVEAKIGYLERKAKLIASFKTTYPFERLLVARFLFTEFREHMADVHNLTVDEIDELLEVVEDRIKELTK